MASLAAIAGSRRPQKVFFALILVTVTYVVYRNSPWAQYQVKYLGRNKPAMHSGTIDMPWIAPEKMPISGVTSQFHNAPHDLKDADEFLQHFKAVTEMKPLLHAETRDSCHWDELEKVNFMYGPDTDWMKNERNDTELSFRRDEWHHFLLNDLIPYSSHKHKFSGRGIVTLAGNGRSLNRLAVQLKQMHRLGSKLPLEIAHWGPELDEAKKADIRKLWPEVYFNDLSAKGQIITSNHDNVYNLNYQLKPAAVMNSRFAEVLLLDSDNIPVLDPETLFDSDVFQTYGTIFWPDIARTRPQNPMWTITNTLCKNDEFEQESGQLMVDKKRYFYHLQLAFWLNAVHGTYYNEFLLGDKDMFRFSWHALQTKYGYPSRWVTSVGTLNPNENKPDEKPSYCGHSFAQHHPNGSVAFLHGGLLKLMPREVMRWHKYEHGGIFQAYKRSSHDQQFSIPERVTIYFDGAEYLPKKYMPGGGEKTKVQHCTNMADVEPGPIDEIIPGGFNQIFEDIGGYWFIGGGKGDDNTPENALFGGQDG